MILESNLIFSEPNPSQSYWKWFSLKDIRNQSCECFLLGWGSFDIVDLTSSCVNCYCQNNLVRKLYHRTYKVTISFLFSCDLSSKEKNHPLNENLKLIKIYLGDNLLVCDLSSGRQLRVKKVLAPLQSPFKTMPINYVLFFLFLIKMVLI